MINYFIKLKIFKFYVFIFSLCFSSICFSQTYSLNQGWNLIGYSGSSNIPVQSFGDKEFVSTIWKWNTSSGKWSFYTPVLEDGGKSYGETKGYELLSIISQGDGFWINVKIPFIKTLNNVDNNQSTSNSSTMTWDQSKWN